MNRSAVAHALSTNDRYRARLGPQFAAAITYFSVLSMVPILMFSFAVLGMTMTVLQPDLMETVLAAINSALSDASLSKTVGAVITRAFEQWASVLAVAVVAGAYSGSNWAGNLKRAVRVMWSKDFEDASERRNFFAELAVNLLIFLGLLVCIVFSIAIATIGTSLSRTVLNWFGWSHIPGIELLFSVVSFVLTFVASWVLMAFLFMVLPNQPARPRPWLVGTLIGAVALTVLQQVAGRLMGAFGQNNAASVFGPVIVVMLMLNIIATTILMSAAWVGSADEWREARDRRIAEQEAEDSQGDTEVPKAQARQDNDLGYDRWAAARSIDDLRGSDHTLPEIKGERYVRDDVAARGMRVNLGLGYGIGAATGLGVGALIVGVFKKLTRRTK